MRFEVLACELAFHFRNQKMKFLKIHFPYYSYNRIIFAKILDILNFLLFIQCSNLLDF